MKLFNVHQRFYLLAGIIVLLAGCDWFAKTGPANEPYMVLVDVLDPVFYNNCTIAGAVNVPFETINEYALNQWDKELANIVVFCANYKCTASGQAANQLKKLGFKNVWAYEGGTAEWYQLGKKEKTAGQPITYNIAGPCSLEKSAYLEDLEKPQGAETNAPTVTAQELRTMLEKFEKAGQLRK